jgi:hypothetical protein
MIEIGQAEASFLVSIIALTLSTASIILSAFALRRQGIPDRFEVCRRIIKSIEQTNPDLEFENDDGTTFEIAYVMVKREAGLTSGIRITNLLKEYITGELQGRTAVGISVKEGVFVDDFEGEIEFTSSVYGDLTVEVGGASEYKSLKEVTIPVANASDLSGYIRWLCIDELSVYTRTHMLS